MSVIKRDFILENELKRYNHYRLKCVTNGESIQEIEELEKRLHSRYQKTSRIKKQLVYLCIRYKYIYFCTFTLDNKRIKYDDRTNRRMIKNVLMEYDSSLCYILNVDFGKTTERKHYHCIVATNNWIPLWLYLDLFYPCFKWCDPIYFDCERHLSRISKYIDKLSNHATKGTTKSSRVYSNFKSYWGDYITPLDRFKQYNEDYSILFDTL